MCKQSLIQYLGSALDIHKEPVFTESASQLKLFGDKKPKQRLLAVDSDKPVVSRQDIEDLIEVGELITEHEATALSKQEKIKNGIQKSTEYTALLPDSIRKNAKLIDDLLADITVCDPAVGSGAFPVGMMNEIVRARNVLSVFLKNKGNTDIPVCALEDKGNTDIPACALEDKGNTDIPACALEDKGNTDIPVCALEDKGNTDIPVCALEDKGNTDIPVCDSLHKTRRNLPHWTKEGSIYWITFRLADSLPQKKLNGWKAERDYWVGKHRKPWSETEWKEYDEQFGKRLEGWLDSGHGSCELAKPEIRKILQECLFRFNEERLRLHAAVIMPNHVHLLLEPLAGNSLPELLKGIKGASSRKINQVSGTTGTKFWMDESYDHIVRSEDQYQHFIQYIAENPVKANLSEDKYWLYIEGETGIPACDPPQRLYIEGETGIPACDPPQPQIDTQTRMSVPRSSYEFKRRCIEHSLYGVDIDPGAVEIAKLRLWLSLVVDEEDIKNIKPLPNLDYKIVCGDSLLGYLYRPRGLVKIELLKKQFINETRPKEKSKLKDKINQSIYSLSKITEKIHGYKVTMDFKVNFSEVFRGNGGFDVVIGNPPYVQIQKFSGQPIQKAWERQNYETFAKTGDIYCLFYEKGHQLLRDKGVLAFITSNKWMRAAYGKKLRRFFAEKTQPLTLIDFSSFQVFEAATVDTNVLLFQKLLGDKNVQACLIDTSYSTSTPLEVFAKNKAIRLDGLSGDSWVITGKAEHEIKRRIEQIGTPLKDWDISIYRGILTGFNEAFIIDGKKKDELIAQDSKSAEIIKPILRGRDIKRYRVDFADLWIIDTHNGYQNISAIEIKDYPAVKKHLDRYWEKIEKRQDQGHTPYNLRNCAYHAEFEKEKIVYPDIMRQSRGNNNFSDFPFMCLDSDGYYAEATNFILTGKRIRTILSVLTSELGIYAFIKFYSGPIFDNKGFRYKKAYLENLPVPDVAIDNIDRIIDFSQVMRCSDNNHLLKFRRSYTRLFNYCIFNNINKVKQSVRLNFVTKYIT